VVISVVESDVRQDAGVGLLLAKRGSHPAEHADVSLQLLKKGEKEKEKNRSDRGGGTWRVALEREAHQNGVVELAPQSLVGPGFLLHDQQGLLLLLYCLLERGDGL